MVAVLAPLGIFRGALAQSRNVGDAKARSSTRSGLVQPDRATARARRSRVALAVCAADARATTLVAARAVAAPAAAPPARLALTGDVSRVQTIETADDVNSCDFGQTNTSNILVCGDDDGYVYVRAIHLWS